MCETRRSSVTAMDDEAYEERLTALAASFADRQAVAEAELAAAGVHPVSVVHGDLTDETDVRLVCEVLLAIAEACGAALARQGGSDYTTFLFSDQAAATRFIGEASALGRPWWRITATAYPV